MHFSNFLTIFLQIFENSPSLGPPRVRPSQVFPPNQNPGYDTDASRNDLIGQFFSQYRFSTYHIICELSLSCHMRSFIPKNTKVHTCNYISRKDCRIQYDWHNAARYGEWFLLINKEITMQEFGRKEWLFTQLRCNYVCIYTHIFSGLKLVGQLELAH